MMAMRDVHTTIQNDQSCWDRYCEEYNKSCSQYSQNIYIHNVDSRLSKGPTDARSKLSSLILYDYLHPTSPILSPVSPTDYCMQTDSHMDFSPGFDTSLVEMHDRTKNDYAVLSTYVSPIENTDRNEVEVPLLCMVAFTATMRNWGTKACRNLRTPKLTNALWGAGLSFHRCHGELNVPYDPYLPNVFDGEEVSRGIRFFTFGYDIYAPDLVLVTHDYNGHQGNPVVHTWGGNKRENKNMLRGGEGKEEEGKGKGFLDEVNRIRDMVDVKGLQRVNLLMGINNSSPTVASKIRASRYGLGTKRTLTQALDFMGVDVVGKKMIENKCGNLYWVPWDLIEGEEDYGVGDTLRRGIWGDEGKVLYGPIGREEGGRMVNEHLGKQSFMMGVCGMAFLAILLFMGRGRKLIRHTN
ncbi:hypothetical protein TrCOL_g8484 [Triparma columacea]|uniref:Uncharacterized protein n=1 Tax=Triparma columacea TaxID=722753 RepID=A0A9W7G457_9STRA|nr:hypothetical protein TrCOL_g8484 [Triparma columacea]